MDGEIEFHDLSQEDLKAFLQADAFLRRFVSEMVLFEDPSASERRADEVDLAQGITLRFPDLP